MIPRESIRHDASGDYVLTLAGDVLERRAVKTGASSVTLVEVVSGLKEGDPVALPSETPAKPGDRVTPSMGSLSTRIDENMRELWSRIMGSAGLEPGGREARCLGARSG